MTHCFTKKQRRYFIALFSGAAFTLLGVTGAFAQTTVDCNLAANCNDAACATVEKGCKCADGIDNDGDGAIDKADTNCASYYGLSFVGEGSDCSIIPDGTSDPFDSMTDTPIESSQNTTDTQSKVSVGDVDGDGIPDAVITAKENSAVRVIATRGGQPDGTPAGSEKSIFNLTGNPGKTLLATAGVAAGDVAKIKYEHENLIADIDRNGISEIFTVASLRNGPGNDPPPSRFYLIAFTYSPATLTPLYAVDIGTNRPGAFGIADFDFDGKGEIYMRDRIYAAETGKLLATGNGDWDLDVSSGPVAVNVTGTADAKLDLVCGTKIFEVPSLPDRTGGSLVTLSPWRDMNTLTANKCYVKMINDLDEYGLDTHSMTSVADMDKDGNIDVVISGALNSTSGPTAVFYWNVAKGTISHYLPPDESDPNGWPWGTSRINLYDLTEPIDNPVDADTLREPDGFLEMTFIAGNRLFCVTTNAAGQIVPPGTPASGAVWPSYRTVNDSRSGVVGVTIYDFNNDGQAEIVYRDSKEVAVIDGDTGEQKLWFAKCESHTYTETPVIADVDGINGTDICVTCNTSNSFNELAGLSQQALGQFRLYYSTSNEWLPTRKVWNQHGYFVVNINDDLTLPNPQFDQSFIFGTADCPNGLPGPQMPMNVFLNQVPNLSASGCPVFPAPDLSYVGDDPDNPGVDENGDGVYTPTVEVIPPICGDLAIQVRFNIINDGDLPISGSIPVSFFKTDPTVAGVTAGDLLFTTNINIVNLLVDQTLTTPFVSFNGTGGTFRLYIVLNNNGSALPVNLSGSTSNECRIDNNMYSVNIVPDPFVTKIEKINDNYKCSDTAPDNGEVRVRIFKGGVEQLDYSPYAFQWHTGDSSNAVVIAGATNYNLTGLAEGDYTALVTNTEKGCVGVLVDTTIVRLGNDPVVTITKISDQTLCNPPNGALQASIAGGNTGFTFDWLDTGLTPLGISGPDATSLLAGNYVLKVSKDGCEKNVPAPIIQDPQIPDAAASVLQHVIDCINPNSGSVTAEAILNTVVQDPANYTFDWYFYNISTNTPGSILPGIYGSGVTRTGLPVGGYQVVITDNTTQCESLQKPIVEITSQTVLPTASITEVASQTSCDPAQPNGVLTASAAATGLVSPGDFTFEWFMGDNTLPANLVTTTSGLKDETVNQVQGGGVFYTVKVTTANNCSDTEKYIITEEINVPVITLDSINNSICNPALAASNYNGSVVSSLSFDGSPVTDFTNYQFTWHNGALNTDPVIGGNTSSITTLNGGFYTLVAERTDLHCQSLPASIEVLNVTVLPDIATDSVASTNCVVTYNGNTIANGQASVTSVDGVVPNANYTFLWSDNGSPTDADGRTTATITQIQGGFIYTVQVTNTITGCQNTNNIQLPDASVIPVVSLTVEQANTICDPALTVPLVQFNGRVVANFTTPSGNTTDYTYAWRNVSDNIALGDTPPVNIGAGVTLLNQFGGLNGNKDYSVIAENTVLGCTSGAAQVYLPNSLALPVIKTDSIASTNCVLNYNGNMIANGQAFVLNVDGAAPTANHTFLWSDNGSSTDTDGRTTATITQIQGGFIYTVQVTNRLTGCRNSDPVPLADASVIPVVSLAVAQENTICDPALTDPSVAFNGKILTTFSTTSGNIANYKYTWRNVTDNLSLGDTPPINTGPGVTLLTEFGGLNGNKDYSVIAENTVLGCTSGAAQVFLPNNFQLPVIKTDSIPSTNCVPIYLGNTKSNGEVSVSSINGTAPTADYTFQWSDDGITPTPTSATTTIVQNLEGGHQYTVLVRSKLTGCINTHTIALPDNQINPIISVTKTNDNLNCDEAALGSTGALEAVVTYDGVQLNDPGTTPLPADYIITWSTSATGDMLAGQPDGNYSATVVNETLGCTSDPDSDVVLDIFSYPTITIDAAIDPLTGVTDQTSCDDVNFANGAANAKIETGSGTLRYEWYEGIGTLGTSLLGPVTGQPIVTYTGITNEDSDDYTIFVRNEITGCESIKSVFIPNNISYPNIIFTGTTPVTVCSPTPNGDATPDVNGVISLGGSFNYSVYYVETFSGGTYPTDPNTIIGAPTDTYVLSNAVFSEPPVYGDMAPGYLTSVVVDNNTKCISNAETVAIVDNTEQYAITIDGINSAGFCNGVGGGINVTVEREDNPGVDCNTCSYTWYHATPGNSDINFFNNPPDMGATVAETLVWGGPGGPLGDKNLGLDADGITGAAPGVGAGTYTLVVIDTDPLHLGCGNYFVEVIPFNNPPIITVTPTDVSKCVAPFDGQVEVDVTGGGSTLGYVVNIYEGAGPATLIASTGLEGFPTPADGFKTPINFSASGDLESGDYYVEVVDQDPTNLPCPLGEVVTLKQLALPPSITLGLIEPNTSCDPGVSADGAVTLTVTQDALDLTTPDYNINNISPNPVGLTFPPSIVVGASGNQVGPIVGFGPGAYTITVTDAVSGCENNAVVNIPDQPVLPTIFTVEAFDDSYCAPTSNGRIQVTSVGVGVPELVSNYEFEWYNDPDVSDAANRVYQDIGGGATTGELFDATKTGLWSAGVTPGWSFGATAGAGNGNRIYYVRGRRITGSGVGCYTQFEQKNVLDVHKTPNLTLTTFFNTSCIPAAGEGVVRAVTTIDADPRDGNVQGTGSYTYTWSPDPAAGNTSGGGGAANGAGIARLADFDITALSDGTYTVTSINSVNGCVVSNTATITTNPLPITLLSYTRQNQLICNFDGNITITEVEIDASNSANPTVYSFIPSVDPLTNLTDNFDFTWFDANKDSDNNPSTFDDSAPLGIDDIVLTEDGTLTATPYATMGEGTYYVIATRTPGLTPGAGCNTVPVRVDIIKDINNPVFTAMNPFANTSCDANIVEGRIEVAVNTTSAEPLESGSTYTYDWAAAIPGPLNPFGVGTETGAANTLTIPPGYQTPPNLPSNALKDDAYTLTVTNDYSGCSVTGQVVITPQKFPITIISFTRQHQLICGPDGNITITEVTIDGSTSSLPSFNFSTPLDLNTNFDFRWFDANNDNDNNSSTFDDSDPLEDGAAAPIVDVTLSDDPAQTVQPFSAMGFGSYYVIATRKAGMIPGAGCSTQPVLVNIEDNHINPQITALKAFANTSCDAGIVEGRIELTVDTNSGVGAESGATYSYTWVQDDPIGNPAGAGNANNVANATATSLMTIPPGYQVPPLAGSALKDDTYTITVRNDYSNCTVTSQAIIIPQKYPITLISFTSQDQMICYPDGNIAVTQVSIDGSTSNLGIFNFNTLAGLTSNFDFSWFDANNDNDNNANTFNNTIPITDGTNPIIDAVLSEDATITTQPFANMAAGTYYVLATRKPGMAPGAGCSTAPVRVDLQDLHVNPVITLTHEPNSSCDPVNPNGIVIATASEPNGSIVDTYAFTWTLNGGALAGATVPSNPDNHTGRLDDAADGNYLLTVTNTSNTGCEITTSLEVVKDLNISTPNIIDVSTIDPTDCLPSASAEVTSISIGGLVTYNTPADLDTNFDYEWYKGDFAPGNILAGEGNHNLLNITPDKYFVLVQDLTTACKSSPKEVVINDDNIVYPVVTITQTQLQISCPSSNGTGQLMALGDGQNDTNPDYAFVWFNNLNTTLPSVGNTSTLSNLISGDYSVSVTNAQTGCSASALYIIPNEAEDFYPQLSLTTQPRINCLVNDGALLAREVGYFPGSGYPFAPNYTTEIYSGTNADISQPGTVLVNVPGFSLNWISNSLDVGVYTVKITDNNTGCVVTDEEEVLDGRTPPVVMIVEDNPLTYCEPTPPNGQLSASADNGQVGGYSFEWYRGATVTGSILQSNNKLIGETTGDFTVRVTNQATGCFTDGTGEITPGMVFPPVPDAIVKQHKTHCIIPDGKVSVSVGGVILNFLFNWYGGSEIQNAPDFTGVDYTQREVGPYTVTATDVITGCISDPATVIVEDKTEIPALLFTTRPSFCEDVPSETNTGTGMIEVFLQPSYLQSDEIVWFDDEGSTVGTGSYITGLYPGTYDVFVRTSKGCDQTGSAEVGTEILAYNLVTRNGDQKNDMFVVDCISMFPNNNVKIFNRAGVKVYEATGYNNNDVVFQGFGQQGVYAAGKDLPAGTYFYVIDKRDGSKPKTGYLELVK